MAEQLKWREVPRHVVEIIYDNIDRRTMLEVEERPGDTLILGVQHPDGSITELSEGDRIAARIGSPQGPSAEGAPVKTIGYFWNCGCKDDYIHPYTQLTCGICGADRNSQPDARLSEVMKMIANSLVDISVDTMNMQSFVRYLYLSEIPELAGTPR